MKFQALFASEIIKKLFQNWPSAAVMIGALRVYILSIHKRPNTVLDLLKVFK